MIQSRSGVLNPHPSGPWILRRLGSAEPCATSAQLGSGPGAPCHPCPAGWSQHGALEPNHSDWHCVIHLAFRARHVSIADLILFPLTQVLQYFHLYIIYSDSVTPWVTQTIFIPPNLIYDGTFPFFIRLLIQPPNLYLLELSKDIYY